LVDMRGLKLRPNGSWFKSRYGYFEFERLYNHNSTVCEKLFLLLWGLYCIGYSSMLFRL